MADNIFQKIAQGRPANIAQTDVMSAREWFRRAAQKIKSVSLSRLFEQNEGNLVDDINQASIGSMFLFTYDPKHKDTLPYYDMYPLIFVVETYNDGFLGINLHYLAPYYRAKLMNALYDIALTKKGNMKLQISYQILKSASKFKFFEPCLKRYLTSHVQSRFMAIDNDKWDTVMMLPLQRFVKASEDVVYKDSRRMTT